MFSIVGPALSERIPPAERDDNGTLTQDPSEKPDTKSKLADSYRRSRDPLRWFGILTPPALRASQQSFKVAVSESIPRLASVMAEMKEVEIEVRRARKKLSKLG